MKQLLALLTGGLLAVSLFAMPPAPGVREKLQREGRWEETVALLQDARALGVDAPHPFSLEQFRRSADRDDANEVEVHTLVLLADFNDNEADSASDYYRDMLFTRDEYQTGSLRDWYLENSYGDVDITGDVFGWYRAREDYAYYVDSSYGFGQNYPQNAMGLVAELLQRADDDVDYSQYDNDDNGVVEALFVVHAGQGAEVPGGSVNDIWSHSAGVPEGLELDGMRFAYYAMEPEDSLIGVFGHELGHSFFGLPDLYDVTYQSAGVGMWSMMAAGSWGGGGKRPVHFDAWSKTYISFAQPIAVDRNTEGWEMLPVESNEDVLLVWTQGEWTSQYYLLENRRQVGFDQSLPAEGLLIWHVDESMNDNAHPWWPGRGGGAHNILALEQADGQYQLEKNESNGDSGDPYPGSSWNQNFGPDTEPSSRDYGGRETDVTIYNIEEIDDEVMRFDPGVFPGPGPEALNLLILNKIPEEHRYPDPDNEEVMTDEPTMVTHLLNAIGAAPDSIADELPENMGAYNTIIYLESWRDEEELAGGLTADEQVRLVNFLQGGNKLVLVGPDAAANLQQDDDTLWTYLKADLISDGSSDSSNIRRLIANADGRIAGQNFPFNSGPCDYFVDVVGPDTLGGAQLLFEDQNGEPRGVLATGDGGYRIILQPFLFGGLIDWGGHKARLLSLYFQHLQFYLDVPRDDAEPKPERFSLLAAYPNPFNNALHISLPERRSARQVAVYDVAGRRVDIFSVGAGEGNIIWTPGRLAAGSYWLTPLGGGESPLRVVYLR